MENDNLSTKELLEFLETLRSGYAITDYDLYYIRRLKSALNGRLNAGRPKIHANDKERWRYHNARRRALKNRQPTVDTNDQVV